MPTLLLLLLQLLLLLLLLVLPNSVATIVGVILGG